MAAKKPTRSVQRTVTKRPGDLVQKWWRNKAKYDALMQKAQEFAELLEADANILAEEFSIAVPVSSVTATAPEPPRHVAPTRPAHRTPYQPPIQEVQYQEDIEVQEPGSVQLPMQGPVATRPVHDPVAASLVENLSDGGELSGEKFLNQIARSFQIAGASIGKN